MSNQHTNFSLDIDDLKDLLRRRGIGWGKGTLAALAAKGPTNSQVQGVEALLGKKNPVAISAGSNIKLREYICDRFQATLLPVFQRDPNQVAELLRFPIEQRMDGQLHWDLKESRRALRPVLKKRYSHSIAKVGVAADENLKVGLSWLVIAWNRENGHATPRSIRNRKPSQANTSLTGKILASDLTGSDQLRAACADMCEINPQANLGPWPSGTPIAKVKPSHHECDLQAFLIQARLQMTKAMFGIGDGDKIVRSVVREANARALSLDVAGVSPLQPEAIEAFLASLPVATGLPTIKLL